MAGWSPHSDVCDVTTLNGPGAPAPKPPSDLPSINPTDWTCSVLQRPNPARQSKCGVCGTKKGYDGPSSRNNLHPCEAMMKVSVQKPHAASRARSKKGATSDDDDDWGLGDGEETWAFTDKDVPARKVPNNTVFDYGDRPPRQPLPNKPKPTYWLNTAATCLHNVRQEPVKGSAIVGHLVQDTEIEVIAEAGNWIKCRYHRAYKPAAGQPAPPKPANRRAGACAGVMKGPNMWSTTATRTRSSPTRRTRRRSSTSCGMTTTAVLLQFVHRCQHVGTARVDG